MRQTTFFFLAAITATLIIGRPTQAQTPVPLSTPGSAAVQALELGDPFFELVILANPQPTRLSDIEAALQPVPDRRRKFVVDEGIKSSAPGQRRSVISFVGQTIAPSGEVIDLDATVMLSIFFAPGQFPSSENGTEAWGWDDARGRYNYYKLNGNTWMFRGTSSGPEVRNRTGCMSCHLNGSPIMKELLVPWANWHSVSDGIAYLSQPPWNPVAQPIFAPGQLQGAERLEVQIISALRRFHRHEAARAQTPLGGGITRIDNARALLRPVFETTEINIASSSVPTGNLHPFTSSNLGILDPVQIPNTHFLNARVLAQSNFPGSSADGTLNIAAAGQFRNAARVPATVYQDLVTSNALVLASCRGPVPGLQGDAHFAWLHPEPGLFDVTRVEHLLTEKIVDRNFVAAVMAVDLRNPISDVRAELLQFVPEDYQIDASGPLDLHEQTLAALDAAGTALPPSAQLFRDRLRSGNATALLEQDVEAYLAEVTSAFSVPTSAEFDDEVQKQFANLLDRRAAMIAADSVFCGLVEGPLLPVKGN